MQRACAKCEFACPKGRIRKACGGKSFIDQEVIEKRVWSDTAELRAARRRNEEEFRGRWGWLFKAEIRNARFVPANTASQAVATADGKESRPGGAHGLQKRMPSSGLFRTRPDVQGFLGVWRASFISSSAFIRPIPANSGANSARVEEAPDGTHNRQRLALVIRQMVARPSLAARRSARRRGEMCRRRR